MEKIEKSDCIENDAQGFLTLDKTQGEINKDILKIKEILLLNGMEKYVDKLVYMPQIPMLGIDKSYVIEEHYGVKVAKLLSAGED